ncbi:MAG: transcriptional regulator, AraC family [Paenibacillaceae bacterium]|nr:transcriptional regulator, AraC family [Paenibacillaceae bacterium]
MKLPRIRKPMKLYTAFVMSITLSIVATVLVSSYMYYRNYTNAALNQTFLSDLDLLTRTSKDVNSMKDSAQSLSFQIYRNSAISKLLNYSSPDVYDVVAGMNELSNMLNSMPFIDSIMVYNSASNTFYIAALTGQNGIFPKEELVDTDIIRTLDQFKSYKPFTPIPRVYNNHPDTVNPVSVYTYLCYDAINTSQTISSAVAVNVSASWINRSIALKEGQIPGQTFIIDNQDRILSTETLLPAELTQAEDQLIRTSVLNRDTDYLIRPFYSVKSLISFTERDSLDWQYVKITPYHTLVDSVSTIRNTSLTIAGIILAAGIMISWLLSGFLYRPVRRITTKLNMLETEKRNNSQTIRQNTLRDLLLGIRTLTSEQKLEKLKQTGITFQFQQDYRVVLLKIDHFQEFLAKRGSDLATYKYAIMNISWEIMSQLYPVETVNMDDASLVLLVNTDSPDAVHAETVFLEKLGQVKQAVLDFLSISISVTYSPVTNHCGHLHPLYEQVKEASLHRMFCGHGSVIDSDDILALKSKEYLYPMDKEKRFSEAIKTGKTAEAMAIFQEILAETAHYPIQVMRLAISHLTMTTNTLITSIQKNSAMDFPGGFSMYMPSLDSVETLEELVATFHAFLEEVHSKLTEKRSMKQGDLVKGINNLIEKRFADPDLNVNWIAEQFDMSSLYISRIYKQQKLHALGDAISEYRMEQAKLLLEQTHIPIAQIADQVGYTSSTYFHRIFKKHFGVTPTEFRKAGASHSDA